MLPGRRSHRKSRAGCLQCKARKVKCDEGKPICAKCEVHGVACSFMDSQNNSPISLPVSSSDLATSTRWRRPGPPESLPDSNAQRPGQSQSQNQNQNERLVPPSSDLAIPDLELLHHYMTSTCYTLSRVPAIQAIWRDQVPSIGFREPFVLHVLLAISALHRAHNAKDSDRSRRAADISRARTHHNSAIAAAVPALRSTSLASDNSTALFLFSSLTCIFSCAISSEDTADTQIEEESTQETPTATPFHILFEQDHLSQWLRLFRGTKAVIDSSAEDLGTGQLGPIFMNGAYLSAARREQRTLEHGMMYVWELKQMIMQEHAHEDCLLSVYLPELDGLARTLAVSLKPGEGTRLETADVFAWLLEASDEYLELLRHEAPIALIILAYFCVAVRQIEWLWWTEGLSARLLGQVYAALNTEYRSWLRWPGEQIGWAPPRIL
ncbi:hypothetical protein BJY01DRAFT_208711 [Aspergillus pseudoustus]|uniref:Zn(2)-C6 fungal-type domain-containing protein n=1 Tax=Aspergillus pseudoustus TaxID=1810923 RepID=A0ABR4KJ68_9EURO